MKRKLYKIEDGKIIDGVCGGLAEYLNADPTIIRLLWVLFSLAYGAGIILYLIAMLIMPKKSEVIKEQKKKKRKNKEDKESDLAE